MSDRFLRRLQWFCLVFPALLLSFGCNKVATESDSGTSSDLSEVIADADPVLPERKPPSNEFEPAMLLTAAGERIKVEEPGYAYPTLFDIDGDGAEDLIVGQFNSGKMKWYRNLSSPTETPEFAEGEWIRSGDAPAEYQESPDVPAQLHSLWTLMVMES